MDLWQLVSGALSGVLVGFTLGLVGSGGSVLAVPLIFYFVGVKNPHLAIGTSAFSVAINAATGLFNHARAGHVVWACGAVFSIFGVLGATLGSTIGKSFDGQKLLFLFALLMVAVGVLMLRRRAVDGDAAVQCTVDKYPRVIGFGLVTGAFSGFFGIGGGFLSFPACRRDGHDNDLRGWDLARRRYCVRFDHGDQLCAIGLRRLVARRRFRRRRDRRHNAWRAHVQASCGVPRARLPSSSRRWCFWSRATCSTAERNVATRWVLKKGGHAIFYMDALGDCRVRSRLLEFP